MIHIVEWREYSYKHVFWAAWKLGFGLSIPFQEFFKSSENEL